MSHQGTSSLSWSSLSQLHSQSWSCNNSKSNAISPEIGARHRLDYSPLRFGLTQRWYWFVRPGTNQQRPYCMNAAPRHPSRPRLHLILRSVVVRGLLLFIFRCQLAAGETMMWSKVNPLSLAVVHRPFFCLAKGRQKKTSRKLVEDPVGLWQACVGLQKQPARRLVLAGCLVTRRTD